MVFVKKLGPQWICRPWLWSTDDGLAGQGEPRFGHQVGRPLDRLLALEALDDPVAENRVRLAIEALEVTDQSGLGRSLGAGAFALGFGLVDALHGLGRRLLATFVLVDALGTFLGLVDTLPTGCGIRGLADGVG